MAEGNRLLQIQDLTAWYDPGRPVLSGLSLELGEREAVGLIGLNGAGKTTLMSLLSGLHEGFTMAGIKAKENPFREYLAYAAASYSMPLPDVSGLVEGFQFEKYTDTLLKELSTGNLKKYF